ncbi:MAG: hypothetical protein JJU00_10465 [Opitutales bacterium]|nr:hypothetical protein [Opitutales bacterium]
MRLFLGIDGGGSHTRAWLADEAGACLGGGAAAGSNPVDPSIGLSGARAAIEAAVNEAFAKAGIERQPAEAAFLGIAGVSNEAERQAMARTVAALALAPAARTGVGQDLCVAHEGALAGGPGLILVAGTGSACYGRNEHDEAVQTGGHGSFIDDGGGGFALGRDALAAVARAGDGRGPETALTTALTNRLGAEGLRTLSRTGVPRRDVAALAVVVIEQAEGGDAVAAAILDRGADELAHLVLAAARRVPFPVPCPVALCGGLTEFPLYRNRVLAALERECPAAHPVQPRLPPVGGAVLLAMRRAGIHPREAILVSLARAAQHAHP